VTFIRSMRDLFGMCSRFVWDLFEINLSVIQTLSEISFKSICDVL